MLRTIDVTKFYWSMMYTRMAYMLLSSHDAAVISFQIMQVNIVVDERMQPPGFEVCIIAMTFARGPFRVFIPAGNFMLGANGPAPANQPGMYNIYTVLGRGISILL